ncbi:hypothetical protein Deipe_3529 [Deinococcus peraridilitoris DSM 19664]|uniref:Copper chaperone PCu(A)C n=2 Tax=Deinococcus TaxID=1298 RepID=L0A682_DEIPD|nr:hypothetical protein Deipe_3529 [Deinococcus peraridilitoris DSM 19664]
MAAALAAVSPQASAQVRTPTMSPLQLQPTANGVMLVTTMTPRGAADTLQRAFVARHATNMLLCDPRCKPVNELPLGNPTAFGPSTSHRVIVGGKFQPGQKLHFIMQFASGVSVVEAVVTPNAP